MRQKLHELFGIDLRSLAAFRIALGLVLALDQLWRLRDVQAHYSDAGILPRQALTRGWWAWHGFIHQWSGAVEVQAALLWLSVALAVCVMIGWQTRGATFLSWLLLISLHTRNPYILQGSDLLFRSLLFWSIFLPLEARWSVDAARKRFPWEDHRPTAVVSMASAALLLQVCLVYWCSGFLKSYSDWVTDGSAVQDALLTDCWTTDFGRSLLAYPDFLRFLSRSTYWLEIIGPTIAFCPIWTGPIRVAVVFAFIAFHIPGLGTTMLIGAFPYVSALSWLVFLPGGFWDFLERHLPASAFERSAQTPPSHPFEEEKTDTAPLTLEPAHPSQPIRSIGPVNVVLGVLLVYVILWNLQVFSLRALQWLPSSFWSAGYALRLDQRWNMFAPYPARRDGWYVIVGTTADGWSVDLFRGGTAVSWEKPKRVSDEIPSYRWRSFLTHISRQQGRGRLADYARYLCQSWNAEHHGPNRVVSVQINFLCEETIAGKQEGPPKRYILYEHQCAQDLPAQDRWDLPAEPLLPDLPSEPDNT